LTPHTQDPDVLLKKGLESLGIGCSEGQVASFLEYLSELKKWNRAYNLTALRTDEEVVIKHFLDSALYLKALPADAKTVADIGSGAGFPGIPIAILRPDLRVFLIEPSRKKALFLDHIRVRLGLKSSTIIDARIEDIIDLKVDIAMTRALFSVDEFITKAAKILTKTGILLLNKGPKVIEELKGLDMKNIVVTEVVLPFEKITRYLVSVKMPLLSP
jgi:16S rRNA (guanine527-N7)-methyltransferase